MRRRRSCMGAPSPLAAVLCQAVPGLFICDWFRRSCACAFLFEVCVRWAAPLVSDRCPRGLPYAPPNPDTSRRPLTLLPARG